MNTNPGSCTECEFFRSCSSGMYMNGCTFYGPSDKSHEGVLARMKSFFAKFFR